MNYSLFSAMFLFWIKDCDLRVYVPVFYFFLKIGKLKCISWPNRPLAPTDHPAESLYLWGMNE